MVGLVGIWMWWVGVVSSGNDKHSRCLRIRAGGVSPHVRAAVWNHLIFFRETEVGIRT